MSKRAFQGLIATSLFLLAAMPRAEAADATGRKIGLALSGGGARGAAHVGVLKVLEELGVQPDYVAGTSMGAIVGGLYASGLSPSEIEAAIGGIDWADAFKDQPRREDLSFRRKLEDRSFVVDPKLGFNGGEIQIPLGTKQGQKLSLLLQEHTQHVAGITDFDLLPIPFRAVAADIVTGERVVLDSGSLGQAIRASMSIPSYFAPAEIEGRLLVDGGIVSNLPIDVVREMGADLVIAVDISTPLATREDLKSSIAIFNQLNGLLIRRDTDRQIRELRAGDLLLAPELGEVKTASFDRLLEAVAIGEAEAREHALDLSRYAAAKHEGSSPRVAEARQGRPDAPIIDFVRAETNTRLDRRLLTSRISQALGQPLDFERLKEDIGKIYGLDVFESVSYRIVEEDGRRGLVVDGRRRQWGPNFLQFGFGLSANGEGDSSWDLAVAYTLAERNRLNGEWRNELQVGRNTHLLSEFHQPLDLRSRWFVNPGVGWRRDEFTLHEDGDAKADYTVSSSVAGLAFGREFGTWGEIRVGARRSWNEFDVLVGDRVPPADEYDGGIAFARLSWDELDDLDFPKHGLAGALDYTISREGLGAEEDQEYDLWSAKLTGARTWGANTLVGGLLFDRTSSGTLPVQDLVSLGGFLELSGLNKRELRGQHRGLARLMYYRTLSDAKMLPTHVGFSLETGRVWDDADDIGEDLLLSGSVFFGLGTPAGPVYIGVGHDEDGNTAAYFFLGRIF